MANFKKVFNFREGVQVDDQTFVVNGSLVGIGTSIPTKFLDVRSEAAFSGLSTFTEVRVTAGASFETGVGKSVVVGNFEFNQGIVTSFSGVVTYFGDGSQLTDLPTSQWVDVDTGIGVSSVYNGGFVGISTLNPQYQLQVGGNPEQGSDGFAVNLGNVFVSGAMTAFRFVGDGALLVDLNASELSSGIVTQARIPRLELDKIPLIPDTKLEQNLQISGILTAQGGFIGSVIGNVRGDIISSGFSTFTDAEVTGSLTAVASTALSLQGTPDIRVGFVSANCIDAGIAFTVTRADVTGDISVGILTVVNGNVKVGAEGIEFNVTDGKIGIGTTVAQTSEVVILGAEDARLEVVTERGYSAVNIGGDLGIGVSSVELRYFDQDLSLSNYADGDFIYHVGNASTSFNGNFRWLEGNSDVEIMTLTNGGLLGIGVTNPGAKLEVTGITTLNGTLFVQQAAEFADNVVIYQGLTYYSTSGIATAFDLEILNDITVNSNAFFNGVIFLPDNTVINNTSGISTFNDLNVAGALLLDNDFNYLTATGITTVNDFTVNGILRAADADISISISSGVSTLADLTVAGVSTFAGIATFASGTEHFGDIIFRLNESGDSPAIIGTGATITVNTQNIDISDEVTIAGAVTLASTLEVAGPAIFSVDTNLRANTGISSFNDIQVGGIASISRITGPIFVDEPDGYDAVGINTFNSDLCIGGYLTVGLADTARGVLDVGYSASSFAILPNVDSDTVSGTSTIFTLDQAQAGAMLYNSTLNKMQFFNGTTWETITSS
jgi:hypothetical protein